MSKQITLSKKAKKNDASKIIAAKVDELENPDDTSRKLTRSEAQLLRDQQNRADPYLQELARRIIQIRKSRNMSTILLAALTGFNFTSIYRIEKSCLNPSLEMLRKIAKVLDCHVSDLLPDRDMVDNIPVVRTASQALT